MRHILSSPNEDELVGCRHALLSGINSYEAFYSLSFDDIESSTGMKYFSSANTLLGNFEALGWKEGGEIAPSAMKSKKFKERVIVFQEVREKYMGYLQKKSMNYNNLYWFGFYYMKLWNKLFVSEEPDASLDEILNKLNKLWDNIRKDVTYKLPQLPLEKYRDINDDNIESVKKATIDTFNILKGYYKIGQI